MTDKTTTLAKTAAISSQPPTTVTSTQNIVATPAGEGTTITKKATSTVTHCQRKIHNNNDSKKRAQKVNI